MSETLQRIQEWHNVDAVLFEKEIVTRYKPAILKGLVKDWPVVRQSQQSSEAVCNYLRAQDNGADVDAITVPPADKGRIFYQPDMGGFNFAHSRMPVSKVLEQIMAYSRLDSPPSIAAQSALTPTCLPQFAFENQLPLLSGSVTPRIWIGNRIVTPAHIDESHNIACVVAGKRRFTLFPPEQASNLYLGPIDFNPTGSAISMVSLKEPDFDRYPRFREALAAAVVADLEPGDALFIPAVWWHHVESLDTLNILVNYWWKSAPGSPFASLMHCALNMNDLSPELKAAWGAVFNHFIFNARQHPLEHIPEHRRGVLGKPPQELVRHLKNWLSKMLQG